MNQFLNTFSKQKRNSAVVERIAEKTMSLMEEKPKSNQQSSQSCERTNISLSKADTGLTDVSLLLSDGNVIL